MRARLTFVSCLLLTALLPLAAQDFGFGFDDESTENAPGGKGGALVVSIGGEVTASVVGFYGDFADGADQVRLGDLFSGRLNFTAETSRALGVVNLKFAPGLVYYDKNSPVYIDEAYLRAYFGSLDIEAGLRKIFWGKADSMGPLDVINPLDYSDISTILSDPKGFKIARPLVHTSWHIGQFSKLEGVFIPNFTPTCFAETERWAVPQFAHITNPDGMDTLAYFQAAARFTTTINGAADVGIQYYYGRQTMPSVADVRAAPPVAAYNPYHQIGVDYAQVLAGFNVRAELAANITEDIRGDDTAVKNPALAWSLGFDRDLFWGISLNAQCNETVRLLDGKIRDSQDIEADADVTSTRLTAALSKNFLRDELAVKAAVLWEIESGACFVMPSLIWTKDDVAVEVSTGVFAGNGEGLFGQFHDNSFVKVGLKYTF